MTEENYRRELEIAIRQQEQAISQREQAIRAIEYKMRGLSESSSDLEYARRELGALQRALMEDKRELQVIGQIQSQIEQTLTQWKQTVIQNEQMERELDTAVLNVQSLENACREMGDAVDERMSFLSQVVGKAEIDTNHVFEALRDLSFWYGTFKNISSASKYITQFTDEYYTSFSYYNELRRITLGYVIGLDKFIISSELMRKKVEKAYLQNTEYWLAYCISAVMLWRSDEKEAAKRALRKSLKKDYYNSCLFYLLINLRFGRIDTAKEWYAVFLSRVDTNNLGDEWQYLLQAFLCGAFGTDKSFQDQISENFQKMLAQAEVKTVDFGERIIKESKEFTDLFLHKTSREFNVLRRTCAEYDDLISLLSSAEKNSKLAMYYNHIYEIEVETEGNLPQRIENVLYSLISSYDSDEKKLVKKIKYNEAIINAKGDLSAALANYNNAFADDNEKKNFLGLLLRWAFADETLTNIAVKQFAITFLKEWIIKGVEKSVLEYQEKEKEKYNIKIDDYKFECSENDFVSTKEQLEKSYDKSRFKNMVKDKQVLIYSGICLLSLILLLIIALHFMPAVLTIAVICGIGGSFLLWRRLVDVSNILKEKKRKGIGLLKKSLDELRTWRKIFREENEKKNDLIYAINKFGE